MEGFEPPAQIEPEPPRLYRGQQPNGGQNQKKKQGKRSHNGKKQGQGQKQGNSNNQGNSYNQSRNNPNNKAAHPNSANGNNNGNGNGNQKQKDNPNKNEHMSEAARHQAMPQAPLFNPKGNNRHRGNRGR